MPRPKNVSPSELTPGQASYVLQRLLAERRISAADVTRHVGGLAREISDLESRLNSLRAAHGSSSGSGGGSASSSGSSSASEPARRGRPGRKPGRPAGSGKRGRPGRKPGAQAGGGASSGSAGAGTGAAEATSGKKGRRGRKAGGAALTPEQLASRQLQGRYLALVRRFPENRRAQYAKVAKEKGREAAIKEMQDAVGKK